jgi:hypothetical protein
MLKILRFTFNLFLVPLAALLGNYLGGQLRFVLTGEKVQTVQFEYTSQKGRTFKNSPVASKFYPALLFAWLGKPRWVYAFLGGLAAGAMMPEEFEHVWLERVIEPLFIDRVLGEAGEIGI